MEARVPASHPLRHIRDLVNGALSKLERKFETLYSAEGRPSIPPERLVRASLLQLFYSIWRILRGPRRPSIEGLGLGAY
jgi:transposase